MTSLLVLRGADTLASGLAPTAGQIKTNALEKAKAVVAVNDDFDNENATIALTEVQSLLRSVEKDRQALARPLLDAKNTLDGIAKSYVFELQKEESRLSKITGDYNRKIRMEAAEAEAKRQAELQRIAREQAEAQARIAAEAQRVEQERLAEERAEQEKVESALRAAKNEEEKQKAEARAKLLAEQAARFAAEAKAKIEEESKRLAAEAAEKAKLVAASVPPAPIQPENLRVRVEWTFEVVNPMIVYTAHPEFCEVIVKASPVKAALKAGLRECPGLRIFEETSATTTRR